MIGKKKTFDVQFYREASDMAFDETGGRKRRYRYGDEDELQQEQEERRRKALLDKEFKAFAETISDASNGLVDLDIPFRELGFQGVPFRSPVVHINTIPMELLEDVKSWLTDVDIPLSEGQMNLNWGTIMKTVQSDPYQFFADGGWSFLTGDGDSDASDEEEEESEFEVSDEDPSDEEVESEQDSEDDYSSGGGSDESDASADESDEGEDWDEMERKAAREDKRAGRE
ncbi:FACT complex subunit spt16 [Cerrena zonata]|uniref:FACT complex subunit n=1 Tax=Cerrena zonata TaxID=2478898 RepID=A0AAW0FMR2_9APHY